MLYWVHPGSGSLNSDPLLSAISHGTERDRLRARFAGPFGGDTRAALAYLASVHKRASPPVMDSLGKNAVLLRSHLQ